MNTTIFIADKESAKKPGKGEISEFLNKIETLKKNISIKELEIEIGEKGKSFLAAVFENKNNEEKIDIRKGKDFAYEELFPIDIDHKLNECGKPIKLEYGLLYKEIREKIEKFQINPLFIYRTFSDGINGERFRIVFKLDVKIREYSLAETIFKMLLLIFEGYADTACKNPNRVFFGGKSLIDKYKYGKCIELDKLFQIFTECYMRKNSQDSNKTRNFKTLMASYGINTLNNFPHVRRVNINSQQIKKCEELKKLNDEKYKFDNSYFTLSNEEYNEIFNKKVKLEEPFLYYLYYRTGTPTFTNGEQEYYEICRIKEKRTSLKKTKLSKVDEKIKYYKNVNQNENTDRVKIKEEKLYKRCELYRDLKELNCRMSHNDLFILATNFINSKITFSRDGKEHKIIGENYFLDLIEKYSEELEDDTEALLKWKYQLEYIKNNNYSPAKCRQCQYYNKCKNAGTILDSLRLNRNNRIIKNEQNIEYKELNFVRKLLKEEIKESMKEILQNKHNTKKLSVIKCQTGVGKTYNTMLAIKDLDIKDFYIIYSTPTIKAKNEFDKLLYENNIPHITTTNLEEIKDKRIKKIVDYYFDVSSFCSLKKLLKRILYLNSSINEEDKNIIKKYLSFNEDIKSSKCNILVTTHKKLTYLPSYILDKAKIIIDEDFISNSRYEMQEVSLEQVNSICEESETIRELLLPKINEIKNRDVILGEVEQINLQNDIRKRLEEEIIKIKSKIDVISILKASIAYYDKNNEESKEKISFINVIDLPNNDIILLSATANEEFYSNLYAKERKFKFIQLPKVKYYGKIYQYCDRSFSKRCLKNNPKILDYIKSKHPEAIMITFKHFCDQNIGDYNFGAVNAINELQGKNLVIAGCYRKNSLYYHLLAYDIYEKRYNAQNNDMNLMENQNDEHTFLFYTYSDEVLRKIELWDISSELEQSIGRARLVKPEHENINVYVYSGYPAEQAELCKIENIKSLLEVDYEILDDDKL